MVKICLIIGAIFILISGILIGAFQAPEQQRVVKDDLFKLGHLNKDQISIWSGVFGIFFISIGGLVYYIK
ncbi:MULTISPECIES: hypothetical protein [Bacillaceae]|uniref:DUF3185 family protein n=1 Tax=Gottfriedia luciferensis TaxID=178774 RepID=A0ABX2ZWS5_9BACI|nr:MULTISPECIES: hypothetical protein [Bacillaceae]ODG94003.1 hypothetical protein BED47_02200 [Gottfriedia luciferensis]PGZ85557.1 hypothetical protein COE53_22550 [Bacillus sp. AFS029533]